MELDPISKLPIANQAEKRLLGLPTDIIAASDITDVFFSAVHKLNAWQARYNKIPAMYDGDDQLDLARTMTAKKIATLEGVINFLGEMVATDASIQEIEDFANEINP